MPLLTKPLSPQERRAVTLRRQGMSNVDIAAELDVTENQVSVLLYRAKQKGCVFPALKRGRVAYSVIPVERLAKIRSELKRAEFPKYGLYRVIANRTGMTIGAGRTRLWKYDRQQGEKAA